MAGLNRSQLEQFHQQGYLKVEGLLDPTEDLDPVIDEYHGVLDNLAHTPPAGKNRLHL